MFTPRILKKLNTVSYIIIFAFYPELNLSPIVIERSFEHSLKKLTGVSYLTIDQLLFANPKITFKLRDCTMKISQGKCRKAIPEMFSTEIKYAADCLLNWFNKKMKLEI